MVTPHLHLLLALVYGDGLVSRIVCWMSPHGWLRRLLRSIVSWSVIWRRQRHGAVGLLVIAIGDGVTNRFRRLRYWLSHCITADIYETDREDASLVGRTHYHQEPLRLMASYEDVSLLNVIPLFAEEEGYVCFTARAISHDVLHNMSVGCRLDEWHYTHDIRVVVAFRHTNTAPLSPALLLRHNIRMFPCRHYVVVGLIWFTSTVIRHWRGRRAEQSVCSRRLASQFDVNMAGARSYMFDIIIAPRRIRIVG